MQIDAETREYRIDTQLHLYRRAHLADTELCYLVPLCEENAEYPERHSRNMVGLEEPTSTNGRCGRCSSCDVADRRERRAAKAVTR
jgi:hypothetical protein